MSKLLVIALGGNALGKTPQEQLALVKGTASTIVDLVEEGYDVVIGHGKGPQVGMVNLAQCLYAIKKLCFEEKVCTLPEMKKAMDETPSNRLP